jgi:hypothetical protein
MRKNIYILFLAVLLSSCGWRLIYKPDAVSIPKITPDEAKEIVLTRLASAKAIWIGRYYSTIENIDISEKEMHITYLTQGMWVRKRRELTCRLDSVIPEVGTYKGSGWGYIVKLGLGCGDMMISLGKNEKAATNLAEAFYILKEAAKQK